MSFRKQSTSSLKKKHPSNKKSTQDHHDHDYKVDTNSNEFLEVCNAVYVNELKSLDEEISSSEELLLRKEYFLSLFFTFTVFYNFYILVKLQDPEAEKPILPIIWINISTLN